MRLSSLALVLLPALCLARGENQPPLRRFSNVFEEAEIRLVLREVGGATGTRIVADSSVKAEGLSLQFDNDSVESALDKLSLSLGLVWKRKGDIYLVSTGAPDSPLFFEFASTRAYFPKVEKAESLYALLARPMQAYAQVDKTANLITVTAPPKQMQAVMASLSASDQPRLQFTVEALVTEMTQEDSSEAGFSWSWKNFAHSMESGLAYSSASSDDVFKMKALIGKKKASLLANPTVLASEGKEASITVGAETYYPMVSGSTAAPTIQFQKVNSGIVLTVTGFIEDDGTLNLHLQPEVSDTAAAVNGSPTMTVRKADTYVRVKAGEAIALGGLTRTVETRDSQKVPVLGDIPLIGSIFRSHQKVKTKTEVVILIVPKLLQPVKRQPLPEPQPEPQVESLETPIVEPARSATKLVPLGIPPKGAKAAAAAQVPNAPLVAPSSSTTNADISKELGIGKETVELHEPQVAAEHEGTADVSLVLPKPRKATKKVKRPAAGKRRPG